MRESKGLYFLAGVVFGVAGLAGAVAYVYLMPGAECADVLADELFPEDSAKYRAFVGYANLAQ